MRKAAYSRVVVKLSGEALQGEHGYGVDAATLDYLADQFRGVHEMSVDVGLVVGGGNIWRGARAQKAGMDRATADYAGMLATVINALALQDALERHGVVTRTQTAIPIASVAEPYIRRRAIRHLEKGRVVIFAGGTGNPFMTTDTTAALRSVEINAEALLMAKNGVDGVYDADPKRVAAATRFDHISHMDALSRRLEIMDSTALTMCMDNNLRIVVFDLRDPEGLSKAIAGEQIGTLIS